MKRSDLRLVISAVAKRVRDSFAVMKATIDQRLKDSDARIEEMRKAIPVKGDIESMIAKAMPEPIAPPSVDDIVAVVMQRVPTAEQVRELVLSAMPAPAKGEKGEKGDKGDAVTAEDVLKLIELPSMPTLEEVAAQIARTLPIDSIVEQVLRAMPAPQKGEKGDSVTAEDVLKLITLPSVPSAEQVAAALTMDVIVDQIVRSLPPPQKGDKGDKGDSVTLEEVMKHIEIPAPPTAEEVAAIVAKSMPSAEAVAALIPAPKDGNSVTLADVLPAMESHFAKWALEFERRASDQVTTFLRGIQMPQNGKDGLGFDDIRSMKFEMVSERTLEITVQRGDERIELTRIKLTHPIYQGVWQERAYDKGDTVTRDGCMWIALVDNPSGSPTDGKSKDWQQATKRGRDGRDGVVKPTPPTQVRVPPRTPPKKED